MGSCKEVAGIVMKKILEDGPAREYADGSSAWLLNGKYHRIDGPAIEYANGDKRWYVNGKCHRLDGPAIEYANGDKAYFISDIEYSFEEWDRLRKLQVLL